MRCRISTSAIPTTGRPRSSYALALNATALPTDKTFANQRKAAAILEPIFAEQPNHPGVAHYLIHSDDAPPLAKAGLPAARRYAEIAPSVPHALHMPSHIFTRLGYWQELIDTNLRSVKAGQAYAKTTFGDGVAWDQSLHAMDYLAYAYLQLGQNRKARGVVDEIIAFKKATPDSLPAAYAIAAIPARYAVERRDWAEAAKLELPPVTIAWDKFPWAKAMITFARALGDAHTGNLAGAKSEIDKLAATRDRAQGLTTNTGPTRSRRNAGQRRQYWRTRKAARTRQCASCAPPPISKTGWRSIP